MEFLVSVTTPLPFYILKNKFTAIRIQFKNQGEE
jgi:hypothetical protein